MRQRTRRQPLGRTSIGTAVVLMALGGVIAFGVRAPDGVEKYVDVLDLGLILIWAGILVIAMQVLMTRPPRGPRVSPRPPADEDDRDQDSWADHDVHRPGYAGETRRLPTIRGR